MTIPMTSFYRFRPIERLLGESSELESQTIYFASPEELNDPMEGFIEVFFRGDEIVWENLFRHFAGCLASAVVRYLLVGEAEPLTFRHLPVLDPLDSPVTAVVDLVSELSDRLVADEDVQLLVRHLAGREVSESELRLYLKHLHQPWALEVLHILPREPTADELPHVPPPDLSALMLVIATTLESGPEAERAMAVMLRSAEIEAQKRNLRSWATIDGPLRHNRTFIHVDFVEHYLKALRLLLHPEWFTACFMDNIGNASVWGHYARGHREVCLKFRATMQGNRATLPLRAPVGAGNAGIIWSVTALPFKQVTYTPEVIRLNFFTAMGNLPIPTLNRVWRVSRTGKASPIEREVHGDEDAWRAGYWKNFESSITRKQQDWSPEREHRITFHSNINDLSEKVMRLLRYNFEDLEGIIFGVKTAEADKAAIVRAIREKCAKTARTDFEFFQAEHRTDGSGMDVVLLGTLSDLC